MKKSLLWGAIATLFFASCSKNEFGVDSTIEQSGDFVAMLSNETRTELKGTSVVWNAEDELTIFTKTEHNRQYKVKDLSEDGRTATFGYVNYTGTSSNAINANYAVYPYNVEATISGDVISTAVAAEQVYNAEKVDLSNALMVAKSESNSFAFVNAGALMRFNISKSELLPDSYTLVSIKLSSAANNIAGDVTIDLGADSKAVVSSNGSKEITLTAINAEITTDAQSFYVALPATTFADKDLSVSFTFADGVKTFALPAFDLIQGSIKTIAYKISDFEDFTGTTPGDDEDFEGETPDAEPKPASNEIWYTNGSTTEASTYTADAFDVNVVSNTYDSSRNCWVLKFDGDVTAIGIAAFVANNMESVILPEGLTSIGDRVFYACSNLSSIDIPESVTSMGISVFYNCTSLPVVDGIRYADSYLVCATQNLSVVNVRPGTKWIGTNALQNCSNLSSITLPEGLVEIGEYAFPEEPSSVLNVVLPSTLKVIGYGAFCNVYLESIALPNGLQTIGDGAFAGNNFTEITIPASVTYVGKGAFSGCPNLATVNVEAAPSCSVGTYLFGSRTTDIVLNIPAANWEEYAYSEGWGQYVYLMKVNGQTPTLRPVPVCQIWCCTNNDIDPVPSNKDGLPDIISNKYDGNKWSVMTFAGAVTSIAQGAYFGKSLVGVAIPKTVTTIGDGAFANNPDLVEVYCAALTPPTGANAMFAPANGKTNKDFMGTIYVPRESVDAYKAATYWKDINNIVGYDF